MKTLTVLLMVIALAGCASMNLPDNASQEMVNAAYCKDAQVAMAVADAALSGCQDQKVMAYWLHYKAGAQAAVDAYCPKK